MAQVRREAENHPVLCGLDQHGGTAAETCQQSVSDRSDWAQWVGPC